MKLLQIYEDDLQKLEFALPKLFDRLPVEAKNDPAMQVLQEECREVLANVRWNYGPHTNVQRIDPEEPCHG